MICFNLLGEEKTVLLGEIIAKNINAPILIYLKGDLGAGKTHLSKGIAKGLGIEEEITSPTFTLINEYEINDLKFYHLDLYRLDSLNQILDLGIEDFIDNDNSIVLIEWAEKLGNYKLSSNLIEIEVIHKDNSRDFIIDTKEDKYKDILEGINKIVSSWN
ncbi:MAG: tRNA (adenosine(37)-N6)-threonylcarbamoyltransferase complex ATPase subunit type 1 TsaE [Candidatus Sericytochromatia bacterium]